MLIDHVNELIDSSINQITGFKVIDNGIGFDENNMRSFLQSDSTYRADKGGKGVGRFSWLKPNLSEMKLDDELYRLKRKFDVELKTENAEIIRTLDVGLSCGCIR